MREQTKEEDGQKIISYVITLYDPVSRRYIHAMPTADCAVGELMFVDKDDPARNISTFKIHDGMHPYFNKELSCC